jgi:hypothetical protein
MKLEVFNRYLTEEKQLADFLVLLESLPNYGDLEDFASDALKPGVKILQDIIRGNTSELTTEDIELAMKTWMFLRRLLVDSYPGLQQEVDVTNVAKKYRGDDPMAGPTP